ncbi:MAG: glycosyltransferase family 9 protein [Desulfovibrio sp.]
MNNKPILILQMQRMGDLILTYPLILWLQRIFPQNPIHVVAESVFFQPLLPVGPNVHYHSWDDLSQIRSLAFQSVINLSIQDKAAALCAQLNTDHLIGPVIEQSGPRQIKRIHGNWQLYRASLVENNGFNRFHWAELNALDIVPRETIAMTRFDAPRTLDSSQKAIGLFIGASEPTKRPDNKFWIQLAETLLQRGYQPILFGGPAEAKAGAAIEKSISTPVLNYCGKLGLDQLALVGQTLQLFITPDTGPMHLSAWTGTKTLNISMGNVNPWETGPYQPHHYIVRADMDCAHGCWSCTKPTTLCHAPFLPRKVAKLAIQLATQEDIGAVPELLLYKSGKNSNGLYQLEQYGNTDTHFHGPLSLFWQHFMLGAFEPDFAKQHLSSCQENLKQLAHSHQQVHTKLHSAIPHLFSHISGCLKTGALNNDFWEKSHPVIRPLSGLLQLELQNGDYSPVAIKSALKTIEQLASLFE